MLSAAQSAIQGDLEEKKSVMPLAGGASDKFGSRYEGRWTVYCMIDVMDERADAIRLEPPWSTTWRTRRGAGAEGRRALLPSACHPLTDSALADPHRLGNLALRSTLLLGVPGL